MKLRLFFIFLFLILLVFGVYASTIVKDTGIDLEGGVINQLSNITLGDQPYIISTENGLIRMVVNEKQPIVRQIAEQANMANPDFNSSFCTSTQAVTPTFALGVSEYSTKTEMVSPEPYSYSPLREVLKKFKIGK